MNKLLFFIIFLFVGLQESVAQAINTPFGKNRVQYHNDFNAWTRYETENFVTYWYGKSRNIAQPVIQMAEMDHDEVQKVLEHTISDKIEIIVYIDITDLKQSNIGLEEAFTNTAGTTKIQGHKMFVHFDGNHLNLRSQIKKGIAQVYLNSIMYGSNFQEMVQNALLLNLPNWFSEGIAAYSASPWDIEIDDELRDLLLNNASYRNFEKFADEHARAAGHSFWHYIALKYDPSTIANIIYLTRINRNLENSFLFILGEDFDSLKTSWYDYYLDRYKNEQIRLTKTETLDRVKTKNKKGVGISAVKMSPSGQYLAYVTNDRGKVKLYVRDMETGKDELLFRVGSKNLFQETDFNYPLIAWHPRKPELSVIYEKRDIIKLKKIFVPNGKSEEDLLTQDFQRIYSLEYLNDEDYIFSASKDGYSDLYIYKPRVRNSKRLTEDFYDDLDASPITYEGAPSVVFRSNRTNTILERQSIDTILPINNFDIFILKGIDRNPKLIQLTKTPEISETLPIVINDDELYYLSGKSGILNAYSHKVNSGEVTPMTNLERNIIIHHRSRSADKHFFTYYENGEYKLFEQSSANATSDIPSTTQFQLTQEDDYDIPLILKPADDKEIKITEGMKFQSKFDDPDNLESLDVFLQKDEELSLFDKYFNNYYSETVQDGKRIIKYSPMRATASRLKFRLADFTTRMDNTVLFEGLESYTGQDRMLDNAPLGILFKATIKDLFEDYDIQVGLRIPTSFNGYEYFAVFDNKKHLLDKRFAFYRKAESNIIDPNIFPVQREKRHTVLGMYQIRYPFDIYTSLRLTSTLRFDKYITLAVDPNSLNAPFVNERRLSLKAEYIFDNSFDVSLNIKNGTRYKAYAEFINEFELDVVDGFNLDASKAYTFVFGFDARHYIPIFRHAVLALRGTGASSVGSSRIVYYLGGMENWLFNSFDESIPVPNNDAFSYKVLAPHLRGFKNNIRNGNTYVLSNVELRVPIFRFLSRKPTGNSFFKNFQITGFFDAGLAWYGIGPNAEDNPLNTIEVSNPPDNPVITINARYFRDPLVMGYGVGARSTLLGYYLKFDYAWGIETGQVLEPTFYFSLGMDF